MKFQNLKDTLDSFLELGIPGFDCIVYKNHKEIFRHFGGYSDIETKTPINGNETYYLYSCTKPIVCTAALTLLEKGKFLLNDPLYEYIPEFKTMYLENGEEVKNPILIRHLFSMMAGFDYDLTSPSIMAEKEKNENAGTLDIVKAIAKEPLDFEPGTKFQYSLCHDVLGGLIEAVSGKTLGEYVTETILDPANMKKTTFGVTDKNKDNLATLYRVEDGKVVRSEQQNDFIVTPKYQSGGAGLVSCVEDYILFADAMANGGMAKNKNKIISQSTIDLMRANRLDDDMYKFFAQGQSAGYGYGLGVRTLIDPASGGTLAPKGEFGWDGAAAAYTSFSPETGVSVFYAEHVLGGFHGYAHPRLRNALYSCL